MKLVESTHWRAALAGLFAMAAAMGIGRFVYTPILPYMIEASILNPSEAGIAAGVNFLGYLLGALCAALPVFGPKRQKWMSLGLFSSVVMTGLSGFWAGNHYGVELFYLVRFVAGVASAFAMIFATTIVMQYLQKERRADLISMHFAGVGVGICLSAGFVSLGPLAGLSWSGFWYGSSIFGLAMFGLAMILLPSTGAPSASGNIEQTDNVDKSFTSAFWFLLTGYGLFGFGYSISATFINTMAKSDPRLSSAEPYVWLVVGAAIIPSIWFWFRVAGKVGVAYAYTIACLVEALGIGVALLVVWPSTLLLSGALLGGTFIAITAMGLAKSRDLAGSKAPQAIALMSASFGLGQMVGPIYAGFNFERTGNFTTPLLAAMTTLVLASVFTFVSKRAEIIVNR